MRSATTRDEVGCIHTCQGLELDYVGVIIGPDLSARDGQVLTHPSARAPQDRTLRGYRRLRCAGRARQVCRAGRRTVRTVVSAA